MRPLIVAFIAIIAEAQAQTPSFSDLIPYTSSFIANRTFPGSQLAVVKTSGQVMFQGTFGQLTYPGDRYPDAIT